MSEHTLWNLLRNWAIIAVLISTIALTADPLTQVQPGTSFLQKYSADPKQADAQTSKKKMGSKNKHRHEIKIHEGETTPVHVEDRKLSDEPAQISARLVTPIESSLEPDFGDIKHEEVIGDQKHEVIIEEPSNPEVDNEIISLNFEKTSLATIVNFLAERKNINIIPHKDLATATISLHNYKPLTLAQAWNMLPTLLEINGFTMNKVGNLYRVVNSKDNKKEPLRIYSSATGTLPSMLPETDQAIRYIYFLRNIGAQDAQSILGNMFIDPSSIDINKDLGVLFIKEKSLTIKAAMQIIEELDVSGLRQSIEIIQLNWQNPTDIARLFNEQINANHNGSTSTIRFITLNKMENTYFSPNVKIMADAPRNALILIGQDREIKRIKDFINKFLDIEPTAESRVHTRDIKYIPADKLQALISNIIKPPQGVATTSLGRNKYFQDVNVIAETVGEGQSLYGSGNRIIVTCGKDDWKRIEKLIDKLDRPQPQIALEVMVIDIVCNGSRDLGAQLRQKTPGSFMGNTLSYGTSMLVNGVASPTANASGLDAMPTPPWNGGTIAVGPANNIWAVVKAFVSNNNYNVISQPFFIVANHQQCTTTAGATQQVIGAFQNTQGLRNQDTVSANNTITLTPSINSFGIVDITIKIDFSDFLNTNGDPNIGQPRTTRTITTRSSMAEGEVLVLGGLTRTEQQDNLYQFPVLSSIPILGNLFKWKQKISEKTNLYVFIRPSIIKPEFSGMPDDYTQFKIDYAKHQVFNFQSYGKGVDPVEHFFFKPRKSSVSEALQDSKANRFSWIDDFTERREQPPSADISRDPFFQQSSRLQAKTEKKKSKKGKGVQKRKMA